MAKELVLTGTATATLVGAWELRAGSMDTTEWLDGAKDVSYPGGGPDTFSASNSDGANDSTSRSIDRTCRHNPSKPTL